MRPGDIVFRKGNSFSSRIILSADQDGLYSHVGIVVLHHGEFRIVHALPGADGGDTDGVIAESIDQFFATNRCSSGAIYRYIGDTLVSEIASRRAIAYLNRALSFDHGYDLEDSTKLYCTELVYKAYLFGGIDITEGQRTTIAFPILQGEYILPSDLQVGHLIQIASF